MQTASEQSTSPPPDEPLPLSFPAILINPRLQHLSHRPSSSRKLDASTRRSQSDGLNQHDSHPIGRRRKHRFENAQFTSNPHVCRPAPRDYQLWNSNIQITFPTQPPRGYPSSMYIPPAEPIPVDPFSATMGAFNRSLKGVRKSIRPLIRDHHQSHINPGQVEEMIMKIDDHLSTWIDSRTIWKSTETDHSHTVIDPNPWSHPCNQPTSPPDQQPSIVEISRSPYMLNWDVPSPFDRYLVHCIARYYGIVSFSRQHSIDQQSNPHDQTELRERRIVCMIKAHFPTSRGSRRIDGHQSLDTPPATDLDSELSAVEVLSEVDSVPTNDDDHQLSDSIRHPKQHLLSSIDEQRETDEHENKDPDFNESFRTIVPEEDSDHHRSVAESFDEDEEEDNDNEKGLKKRVDKSESNQKIEKTNLNLTSLTINDSPHPSDSSFLKTGSMANNKNSKTTRVAQIIQSDQASSGLGLPPHLPHNNSNIKKAQVVIGSEKSINFLDWVRGY